MKIDIGNIKPSYARKGNSKSSTIEQRLDDAKLIKAAPGLQGLSRFSGPLPSRAA